MKTTKASAAERAPFFRRWRKIHSYDLRVLANLSRAPVSAWHERARWLLVCGIDFEGEAQAAKAALKPR